MTLLSLETPDGPRTHAIVIAVGYYPYLRDGAHPRFPGMGDLESPPISAIEFTDWFLNEYDNPSAPRGTLDLYISASEEPVHLRTPAGSIVEIDRADKASVSRGIELWADRVDRDLQDIAMFFFCGHGVSSGTHNGLLLEDFCSSPRTMFKNALDIDGLKDAMDICKARRQIYFSDACRNSPSGIDDAITEHGIGDRVITGERRKGHHGAIEAPIYFSALAAQQAYGRPQQSSAFTAALLESLRRGAAVKEGGIWQVRTRRMLDSLIVNLRRICRVGKLPFAKPTVSDGSDFALHDLPGSPTVPVVIQCKPGEAMGVADLMYRTRTGQTVPRPGRTPEVWDVDVAPDWYEFTAQFADGEYLESSSPEVVQPPGADVQLNVSK